MNHSGELERLLVRAYEQADFSGQPVGEFKAYVNPHEITMGETMYFALKNTVFFI